MKTFTPLLIVLLAVAGCDTGGSDPEYSPFTPPKSDDLSELPRFPPSRIILLIGDGMGVGAITGAAYAAEDGLNMLDMPHMGFMATYNYEFLSTDSAASATAIASGEKTSFEAVGVKPGTLEEEELDPQKHLETVIDSAQASGWRTGLVATTSVVDATPAGFGAHRAVRKSKYGIAYDLSESGIDVLLGAGSKYFEDRSDGMNLLNRMRNKGYSVARTATGLRRVSRYAQRAVALMHDDEMPPEIGERAMSLEEMTGLALRMLDNQNPDGFFLMVEGSQIDRRSHEVDGPEAIKETLDFDRAVGVALAYARGRDDTLVVVTADHETGGMIIFDPQSVQPHVDQLGGPEALAGLAAFPNHAYAPDPLQALTLSDGSRLTTSYGYLTLASRPLYTGLARYFNSPHTPSLVPLFAEGRGAKYLSGARDNSDLGRRLKLLAEQDGVEVTQDEPPVVESPAPVNFILLLADGGGLPTLTSAFLTDARVSALPMPACGLLATHSIDSLSNDHAGAATALATGRTTRAGALGLVPDGSGLVTAETLLEHAERSGLLTGVVSDSRLTNPTLAAFYAHHDDPRDEDHLGRSLAGFGREIASSDGIDLAFGGGLDRFGSSTLEEWQSRGAVIETGWSGEPAATGDQLIRIVSADHLDPASVRQIPGSGQPTLEDMTWTALESLQDRGAGFVLIVHAGGMGRKANALERGRGLIDEVVDFDGAVRAAYSFADPRGDTTVVVTATRDSSLTLLDNHYGFHKGHCSVAQRCGGPVPFEDLPAAIDLLPNSQGLSDTGLQGEYAPPAVLLQYAWISMQARTQSDLPGPGSVNFVPLFASGPGSQSLRGFRLQADAGEVMHNWLRR